VGRTNTVNPYPLIDDLLRPVLRVAMPHAPRVIAPGGTMHVVARCNNRDFYFTSPEDFGLLLAHLRELVRTYETTVYAYTLISNHVHLLLQDPTHEALGRPLRWFMTETARAFHTLRSRRGHFWERRYRVCLVEEETYALAALRYFDRYPVRAGIVTDPTTYPWSSCATYALGTPNRIITCHPSYLGLSRYGKVRQRQYRSLLSPSGDARADARDPRWSTQRAVGSPAFMAPYVPRLGRRRTGTMLVQNQEVRP
jgi:REP-associated tyrosine transposase